MNTNTTFKRGDLVVSDTGHFGTVDYEFTASPRGVAVAFELYDKDGERIPEPVRRGNCFKPDGTQMYPSANEAKRIFKLPFDPRKVTRLTDGNTAKFDRFEMAGGRLAAVRFIAEHGEAAGGWWYGFDGGCRGLPEFPRLVLPGTDLPPAAPAPTVLDTTKSMQLRCGTPVNLEGVLPDGRIAVSWDEILDDARIYHIYPANGRRHGGGKLMEHAEDLINVPKKVTRTATYRNIYADGTIGTTEHKSFTAVKHATKYNKIRVGILRQEWEIVVDANGRSSELVNAIIVSCGPLLRTSSDPEGSNPWA